MDNNTKANTVPMETAQLALMDTYLRGKDRYMRSIEGYQAQIKALEEMAKATPTMAAQINSTIASVQSKIEDYAQIYCDIVALEQSLDYEDSDIYTYYYRQGHSINDTAALLGCDRTTIIRHKKAICRQMWDIYCESRKDATQCNHTDNN